MNIRENLKDIFLFWNKQKLEYHLKENNNLVYFHEGQIWWTALGKNIGYETDGKHDNFHRPVLILKKYNAHMCFVIPLTTQIKKKKVWYQIPVNFKLKPSVLNITQGRTISVKRLLRKISNVELQELDNIKRKFKKQFI